MKERTIWTLTGRKKVFLVDDDNVVIKEINDLGPLSDTEMKWVKAKSELPYKEWLKTLKK